VALVALRDRDHEPEIRVDHPLLGGCVAALDPLRQLDLLLRRQQRVAADLVQEELQAVRGRGGELAVGVSAVGGVAPDAVVRELDPAALELLVELLDRLVVQVVGGEQRLELGEGETPVALALRDESDDVLRKLRAARLQLELLGLQVTPP
jgi:hypothetical protein